MPILQINRNLHNLQRVCVPGLFCSHSHRSTLTHESRYSSLTALRWDCLYGRLPGHEAWDPYCAWAWGLQWTQRVSWSGNWARASCTAHLGAQSRDRNFLPYPNISFPVASPSRYILLVGTTYSCKCLQIYRTNSNPSTPGQLQSVPHQLQARARPGSGYGSLAVTIIRGAQAYICRERAWTPRPLQESCQGQQVALGLATPLQKPFPAGTQSCRCQAPGHIWDRFTH